MKILWVTNVPLTEASLLMNESPLPFGGWLNGGSFALSQRSDTDLFVAFPQRGLDSIQIFKGAQISHIAFTSKKMKNGNNWSTKILELVQPDIVHIFGTEYAHTLEMVDACNSKKVNVVISIQGLVSIYATHFMACLPTNIQTRFTIRDFLRQDNLIQQKQNFIERGESEIAALKRVKHIIGRTTWDRACTSQINPEATYHFCNETLRDEFYKHSWDTNDCERRSIFVSQGSSPIKGLHFMLEAMPIILQRYPETKLYVGGQNITKTDTLMDKIRLSSYGKYIKRLIELNNLNNCVLFTGLLDEKQMCDRFLKSNVFVCPSSIENSPNSLGEAMILGVPCVASDVGGVSDLMKHKEEGFVYQADAPYMLAHYVCEIFADDNRALQFSAKARAHAKITFNPQINQSRLIDIYRQVLG